MPHTRRSTVRASTRNARPRPTYTAAHPTHPRACACSGDGTGRFCVRFDDGDTLEGLLREEVERFAAAAVRNPSR